MNPLTEVVLEGLWYWTTREPFRSFPQSLTVVPAWDRHPCDGLPWLMGFTYEDAP